MANTVTRAYLTQAVYREIGVSYAESSNLVDTFFEESIKALERGEELKLSTFGSFNLRQKNARIGRNPRTKKEAIISSRKVLSFYASNILKKRLNKK
jgi:integration host factor subunit alpha